MPYINKVVFAEWDEVKSLDKFSILSQTDYGTTEILPDVIEQVRENLTVEENKEFLEDLHNSLGETADLLLNGDIDFVLVV